MHRSLKEQPDDTCHFFILYVQADEVCECSFHGGGAVFTCEIILIELCGTVTEGLVLEEGRVVDRHSLSLFGYRRSDVWTVRSRN
jgi:hypothetical protein